LGKLVAELLLAPVLHLFGPGKIQQRKDFAGGDALGLAQLENANRLGILLFLQRLAGLGT